MSVQEVKNWAVQMGYSGPFPEDMGDIVNASTAHIWKQVVAKIKPRKKIQQDRLLILIDKLQNPHKLTEDNKPQELIVWERKKELLEKVNLTKYKISRKEKEIEKNIINIKSLEKEIESRKKRIKDVEMKTFVYEKRNKDLQKQANVRKENLEGLKLLSLNESQQKMVEELDKFLPSFYDKACRTNQSVLLFHKTTENYQAEELRKKINAVQSNFETDLMEIQGVLFKASKTTSNSYPVQYLQMKIIRNELEARCLNLDSQKMQKSIDNCKESIKKTLTTEQQIKEFKETLQTVLINGQNEEILRLKINQQANPAKELDKSLQTLSLDIQTALHYLSSSNATVLKNLDLLKTAMLKAENAANPLKCFFANWKGVPEFHQRLTAREIKALEKVSMASALVQHNSEGSLKKSLHIENTQAVLELLQLPKNNSSSINQVIPFDQNSLKELNLHQPLDSFYSIGHKTKNIKKLLKIWKDLNFGDVMSSDRTFNGKSFHDFFALFMNHYRRLLQK